MHINFEVGPVVFRVFYYRSHLEPIHPPTINGVKVALLNGQTPTASQMQECARLSREFIARLDHPGDGLADQVESAIVKQGVAT